MRMLLLLQERARELGVDMRFETPFTSAEEYRHDYDLVVACDGINSLVRDEYRDVFRPDVDMRLCKFIWLGTHQKFDDAFTFIFEETEHGWMWIHAYQFDADTATVIVECTQQTWDAWGFEHMSKEETIATCERVFARPPRRARVDVERHPPARLGGVDELPAGDLRAVVPRERRADGRRRGDRALLDRLGLAAGVRQRDRPRRVPAQRADDGGARSSGIRPSGESRCCACSRRRATASSGSSRSSATSTSTRCSSTTRCSPGRSGSRTRTCGSAIRSGCDRPRTGSRRRPAASRAEHRCSRRSGCAARAAEPRRRVADGAVQGGRRLPHRLALRPLRRAGQGRRRPGVHRDDLRVARGPDHARLHRAVRARARGGVETADRRSSMPRPTPRSAARSATRAARARPSSVGSRSTRRCSTATGRSCRRRRSRGHRAARSPRRWTATTWTR